jgi:uncharacterized protein YcbK (DUF882 family)
MSIAALALAGCESNNRAPRLGSGIAKTDSNMSWRQDLNSGFAYHSPEPDRSSWFRAVPKTQSPRQNIDSIRQMARRLAPPGVNVSTLSSMVRKRRQANISCIPAELRMLLNTVAWHYGKRVHIQSGYRSKYHNRRVGGAKRSFHVRCKAVDIQVSGVNKYELARFLKSLPGRGGVGTYCSVSTVHIDVGPKRSWHYGCRKRSKKRYARKR